MKVKKDIKYNKLSTEDIIQKFENRGYKILQEFDGLKTLATDKLKCIDNEGYLYEISENYITNKKSNFRKFGISNPYSMYNLQLFINKSGSQTKVISEKFIDDKSEYNFICGQCGKPFTALWGKIVYRKNFNCQECNRKKKSNILKNTNDKVFKLFNENNLKILDDKYIGNNVGILCENKDGYKTRVSYNSLLRGRSSESLLYFSPKHYPDLFIENINHYFNINNIDCKALYFDYSIYSCKKRTMETIFCECACGNIFNTSWSLIRDKHQYRCKSCSSWKPTTELKIEKWLKKKHIEYIYQKTYDDCRSPFIDETDDRGKLPFDFYLPKYNMCIEIDGDQHDHPVRFGGISQEQAEENYRKLKIKDEIKNKYCKNNNIRLLRISEKYIDGKHTEYKKILYDTLIKK